MPTLHPCESKKVPGDPLFCDVSLPVPLDQAFTYRMPETLRHRVQAGCRVLAPLGTRTLTGLVLRTHLDPPQGQAREILRLLDEEPALDDELLQLGKWIAEFYCAPLGETLRAMTPLAGEIRRGKVYSLTTSGRDVARQLHLGSDDNDPAATALRMLDARPLSASYLKQKIENAAAVLKSLEKKGFLVVEDVAAERDPLRASAARLRIEFVMRAEKLPKAERELLSYLELHPGSHNVADLEPYVPKASTAARSLARRELVRLTIEAMAEVHGPIRTPHALNPHQQAAFDCIRGALDRKQYHTFLLQGVTGSGKTEVYLKAIEAALALGRSALMLVPEIGLTPAVAGQFYQRFPGRVAILHSAFQDSERAQEWRRIRSGEAAVVVATRSGVFAPVSNSGPDHRRRRARPELQAAGNAALSRPRCSGDARAARQGSGGAGLRDAQSRIALQLRIRQV